MSDNQYTHFWANNDYQCQHQMTVFIRVPQKNSKLTFPGSHLPKSFSLMVLYYMKKKLLNNA